MTISDALRYSEQQMYGLFLILSSDLRCNNLYALNSVQTVAIECADL